MNEARQTDGTRPSVLAIGVTPHQALQARTALLEVFPEADLLAPNDRATRQLYAGLGDDFRFVELDPRDPIESQLMGPAVVVAVTLASAAAEAAPRSFWQRLTRRRPEQRSPLALLLDGLGRAYEGGFPGPVLLEILDGSVTLVAEPALAPEAAGLAERIVRVRGHDTSHRPLRWSGELHEWVPMREGWSDQAALRALATEIQLKIPG
jgi:hypothetical protein